MSFIAAGVGLAGVAVSAVSARNSSKRQASAQRDAIAASTTDLPNNLFNFTGPGGQFAGFGNADFSANSRVGGQTSFADLAGLSPTVGGGGLFSNSLGGGIGNPFGPGFNGGGLPNGLVNTGQGSVPSRQFLGSGGGQEFSPFINNNFGDNNTFGAANFGATPTNLINNPSSQIFTGLGDLEGSRQGLVQLAQQNIGRAGLQQGLPSNIAQANALQQRNLFNLPGVDNGAFNALQSGVGSAFGQAFNEVSGGFEGVRNDTLSQLRAQAQPFEDRAFNNLQENLFATGRLGSSGGALQTEAFARGLAQADTGRQLQATSLSQGLLNDAFGRFNQTAQLGEGLAAERFRQNAAVSELFNNRGQQNLATQLQLAQVPQQLQAGFLQNATSSLQAQGGLNEQNLANFQAALASSQAAANARIGAGSNIANIASGANFGAGSNALGILGQGLTSFAGSNTFANLFNRQASQPQQQNQFGAGGFQSSASVLGL